MKLKLQWLLLLANFTFILVGTVEAQQCLGGGCSNFGTQYPSVSAPYTPPSSWQILKNPATGNDALMNAGNYTKFSVIAGRTYEWSYCENYNGVSSSWDAQMTLYNDANLSNPICFSTDVCGTNGKAPYISWVANFTGTVRVLTTAYTVTGCQTNSGAPYNKMVYRQLTSCTAPTVQSSNITFPSIGQNSMTINWMNGNGSRRVVYINTVNSFSAPSNGTDPTPLTNYSGGQQCIYNSSGSSVTVTGLTCATTYYVRVYEANCTGGSSLYFTATGINNPKSQATSNCSSLIHGVDVSSLNGTVNWSTVYSTNHSFAYVRATKGIGPSPCWTDPNFPSPNMTSNNPNGVILGAYHVGLPEDNPNAIDEANYFYSVAHNYLGAGFLPPALDLEDPGTNCNVHTTKLDLYYNTPALQLQLAQWVNSWCDRIHTLTGRWPVLYTSRCIANLIVPYYNGVINPNIKLWISTAAIGLPSTPGSPNGSSTCGPNWNTWPWVFHQYFVPNTAGNIPTDGILNSGMDQDVFYGTTTDFTNLINPSISLPDLTITPGTQTVSSTTVSAGSNITAYASEDNSGPASAGSNAVSLWLSASSTLNTNNAVYLGAINGFPSLSPNSNSLVLNSSVNIPSNTVAGTYYLFFWADGGGCGASSNCSNCRGSVNESNECNNFATVVINVTQVQGCTTPASPSINPTSNITATSFTANWQPVSNATSYRIDVATDFGFTNIVNPYNNLNTGNVTTYNITGLNCNTDYYYRIRAFNSCGPSTTPEIKIVKTSCCTAPSAPSTFAGNITSTSFRATWTLILGATSYYLDVATNSSFSNFVPGYNNLSVGNVSFYDIGGLVCNTNYYYRIKAFNSCGTTNSSTVLVTTNSCCTAPISPTAGAASNITSTMFQANWSSVGGATAYFLDVATNSSFSNFVPGYNNLNVGNVTTYNVNGLICNTNYYYRIRAFNSCGAGGNSGVINAVTSLCSTCTGVPNPNFSASPSILNAGQTVQFQSNATNNPDLYSWFFPNGNPSTSNAANPVVQYSIPGIYSVSFQAHNACGWSSVNNYINGIIVLGCTAPTIQSSQLVFSNVSFNQIKLSWSSGNGTRRIVKINTINSFTNPNGSDPIPNNIYNGAGEQVVYNGSGNNVTVTNLSPNVNYCFSVYEGNCAGNQSVYNTSTAIACQTTSIVTGLFNINSLEEFQLIPNPTNGIFSIRIKLNSLKNVSFRLSNLTGQIIYQSEIYHFTGTQLKKISKLELAAGTYLLETRIGIESFVEKIIVVR